MFQPLGDVFNPHPFVCAAKATVKMAFFFLFRMSIDGNKEPLVVPRLGMSQ